MSDNSVHFHEDVSTLLKAVKSAVSPYSRHCLLVNESVYQRYQDAIENVFENIYRLPSGEASKTPETAIQCWQALAEKGLDRQSAIIAMGGGVTTDLAGFVASTYMRGIPTYYIPTTLLSMVDAAIGGKCGVNLPQGKNLVGTFHFPTAVHITQEFLSTLSEKEFKSGLAEVIKYGVIWDAPFFEYLEKNIDDILARKNDPLQTIIKRSCAIKNEVVEQDKTEKDIRSILNWGHTFGHAIEALTDYKQYLHGEAISIGMSCAGITSQLLGLVNEDFVQRQDSLLKKAGLPLELPSSLSIDSIIQYMTRDKKAVAGKISLILAERIGKVFKMPGVDQATIHAALLQKRMMSPL